MLVERAVPDLPSFKTGHYHYHFPASCFLGHQGWKRKFAFVPTQFQQTEANSRYPRAGHVAPGRPDWWAQADPIAFWPSLSKPSPVLGHALVRSLVTMRLPAAEQFLKFQQAADDSDTHLALATSAPCTVIIPEL